VDDRVVLNFANGMWEYRVLFQIHVDSSPQYEQTQQYKDEKSVIFSVCKDDFWVYAPQFKQVLVRTIQGLFRTRVTHFSESNSMCLPYVLVFVDATTTRWTMEVDGLDNSLIISFRMPVKNTQIWSPVDVPIDIFVSQAPLCLFCHPVTQNHADHEKRVV